MISTLLLSIALTGTPQHDFLNQAPITQQQPTFNQPTSLGIQQSLRGQQIYSNWLNRPRYNGGGGNYYRRRFQPIRNLRNRLRR